MKRIAICLILLLAAGCEILGAMTPRQQLYAAWQYYTETTTLAAELGEAGKLTPGDIALFKQAGAAARTALDAAQIAVVKCQPADASQPADPASCALTDSLISTARQALRQIVLTSERKKGV